MRAAVLAGSVLLAFFGSADADEPVLQTFQQLCVNTKADKTAALAVADSMGWRTLPDNQLPQAPGLTMAAGLHVTDFAARRGGSEEQPILLVVGQGPDTAGPQCVVISRTPFRRAFSAVSGWLKIKPYQSWGPAGQNFIVINDGARRRTAKGLSNDQIAAAQARREVEIIQVLGVSDQSFLSFSAPPPAP